MEAWVYCIADSGVRTSLFPLKHKGLGSLFGSENFIFGPCGSLGLKASGYRWTSFKDEGVL